MSADEDTELRDLVAQTLESNGTLGKLRAQLRASVFLALEDQENGQSKAPFLNKELRGFLSTQEGKLTASLVQEFLEFFNLEFTLAVFKPESGVNDKEKRSELLKQLNIPSPGAPPNAPLLTSLLYNKSHGIQEKSSHGSGDGIHVAKDLTKKQIEEAQAKFDYYDKDNSGAIDKDELRDLFIDMFPSFHRNMLERYVNDEFNAVDKDFSSSVYSLTPKAIDFDEFLGMYKRLFLSCRSVVAGDVENIVSNSHKSDSKNLLEDQPLSKNLNLDKSDTQKNPSQGKLNNIPTGNDDGSDIEEDPFFDDAPAAAVNFNTLSSELEKNKDSHQGKMTENCEQDKGKKVTGSGLSSLDGLPSLTSGRGTDLGSLAGAPPLGGIKLSRKETSLNDSDLDKNLRAIDKRMVDLGLDSQNDDYEYEDDFSPEHSLSQKSPRNSKTDKPENGSIAEEIDDEEIDEISIEADDLLRSEKSGFDELTTDHSISQADGGFDYMEDPVLP
ncbi:hypothetical protein RRG08_051961 [Elysia crispata]|uniref:Centrosomal protein 43 n=1 Tax=Elysia crispata TaxID=231223 RepID=A0AAE1DDR2_9GAST|nr:hypothetical protein RRG08_051961 [Elysia crispata]